MRVSKYESSNTLSVHAAREPQAGSAHSQVSAPVDVRAGVDAAEGGVAGEVLDVDADADVVQIEVLEDAVAGAAADPEPFPGTVARLDPADDRRHADPDAGFGGAVRGAGDRAR